MSTLAPTTLSGAKRSFPCGRDSRRVQPRHFHDGPDQVAAAAAAGNDGVVIDSADPSPATHLYRHALESIFVFLNQDEAVAALQVSRSWLAAMQSMRCLNLEVRKPSAPLWAIAASTLGRHVTTLGTRANYIKLTTDSFFILAHHMVHLTKLVCELSLPLGQGLLRPHAGLRELDIQIATPATTADINITLKGISQLSQLNSLAIGLSALDPLLSFASLVGLLRLRILNIRCISEENLTDTQVDELRALPWLQSINVDYMSTAVLARLLRQPHQLQWQYISLPEPLDDETAALVPQLPSLTKLHNLVSCERFDWMQRLPNLTIINIVFDMIVESDLDSLVAGLQCCTAVTELALGDALDLTSIHLAYLLPRLPRLRSLRLSGLDITSLSFLKQQPMMHQLTTLQLEDCPQLPLTELSHVHSLRGLEALDLCRSFSTPMDAHGQMFYTPPSAVLPQLAMFRYSVPQLDWDE